MSKSQVSKVISELLDIFEEHLCSTWIKLENTAEEKNEVKECFYSSGGIPGVVGCVDGTHVKIKSPGDNLSHLYYNRKGFYSINVLLAFQIATLIKEYSEIVKNRRVAENYK